MYFLGVSLHPTRSKIILLGYLKDSNAAAHSVDTGIECPMYMFESTRIFTISLWKELVGTLFRK